MPVDDPSRIRCATRATGAHIAEPDGVSPNMLLEDSGTRPASDDNVAELANLLRGRRSVALVGAGCSTESGIPDYRGPNGSMRKSKPMQYREFVDSPQGRARYWSRSAVGWARFSKARPNAAHYALAGLEGYGALSGIITQNVDGLHHAAGSREVVELHGSLAKVRCLECGAQIGRRAFQERLMERNAEWLARAGAGDGIASAPDGDAELATDDLSGFEVPGCEACDGVLKPDVVFFGESVPKARVDASWALLADAEALLVVGSSLTVFSGRRFVYGAQKAGIPIAIVNLGPTRADELAQLKLEASVSAVLPQLVAELSSS